MAKVDISPTDTPKSKDVLAGDTPKPKVAFARDSPKPKSVLARDTGLAWLMLAASFICQFFVMGIAFSFSLFYIELVEYFEKDRSLVGWIGALMSSGYALSGVAVSPLAEVYGNHKICILGGILTALGLGSSAFVTSFNVLYLTFGIITGFGFGMVWYASVVIVQLWFDKRRSLATGVSACGSIVGVVALAPLEDLLFRTYNWRGTCLILAGVVLNCSALGILYQLIPKDISDEMPRIKPISERNKSTNITAFGTICSNTLWYIKSIADFSILAEAPFLLLWISTALMNISITSFVQQNPDRALQQGVEPHLIFLLPVICSMADAICRVLSGFIGNQRGVDRCVLYIIYSVLFGMVQIAIVHVVGIWYIALCTILVGIFMGGFIGLQQSLLVDFVGIERFPRSHAVLSLSMATGMLVASPLSGYLFDITQDYVLPFALMGSIQILSAVVLAVGKWVLIRTTNRMRLSEVTR